MGEVVKQMGQNKVLVKIHPEGKYVVDIDGLELPREFLSTQKLNQQSLCTNEATEYYQVRTLTEANYQLCSSRVVAS